MEINDITPKDLHTEPFGIRDKSLVDLAKSHEVPLPTLSLPTVRYKKNGRINFIENKIYDFARISDLMTLSISANWHANSGPVCRLLEAVIGLITKLETDQKVVAVSSGTSALHLACNFHRVVNQKPEMRWVTSAFTFKSSTASNLSGSIVIDCDQYGRFDLHRLKELPLSSYDGVIFTNVFGQMADWDDVDAFCKNNNKKLVIDNATGLLDRIGTPIKGEAPIEIISAHHTKPWGVGECGLILCSADQEPLIRKLSNFGDDHIPQTQAAASNFKLSDLAAAAVIDRLERMPFWAPLYSQQESRIAKILEDDFKSISSLKGTTEPKSPRTHAPFTNQFPIENFKQTSFLTFMKYYKPLAPNYEYNNDLSNALALYKKILCIPNNPEYLTVSTDQIIHDFKKILD